MCAGSGACGDMHECMRVCVPLCVHVIDARLHACIARIRCARACEAYPRAYAARVNVCVRHSCVRAGAQACVHVLRVCGGRAAVRVSHHVRVLCTYEGLCVVVVRACLLTCAGCLCACMQRCMCVRG